MRAASCADPPADSSSGHVARHNGAPAAASTIAAFSDELPRFIASACKPNAPDAGYTASRIPASLLLLRSLPGPAHDQGIAGKQRQNTLGCTPQQRLGDGAAATRTHHYQIGSMHLDVIPDERRGRTRLDPWDQALPVGFRQEE